jgi:hypothetical protein
LIIPDVPRAVKPKKFMVGYVLAIAVKTEWEDSESSFWVGKC